MNGWMMNGWFFLSLHPFLLFIIRYPPLFNTVLPGPVHNTRPRVAPAPAYSALPTSSDHTVHRLHLGATAARV